MMRLGLDKSGTLTRHMERKMNLTETVASNLNKLVKEHDLSTRELASRANMNQKSVWNVLTMEHSPRLTTLEPLCKTLLVSPTAIVTPGLSTSMLMSRRLTRLVDRYTQMDLEQRDKLEQYVDHLLTA
jgi:transcriptional regulator with XRE-family HTH domain